MKMISGVWRAHHLMKVIVVQMQFRNCSRHLNLLNLSKMKKIKLFFILYTVKSINYKLSSQFLKKGKQIQNLTILFTRIFWECMIFLIEKRLRVSTLLLILKLNWKKLVNTNLCHKMEPPQKSLPETLNAKRNVLKSSKPERMLKLINSRKIESNFEFMRSNWERKSKRNSKSNFWPETLTVMKIRISPLGRRKRQMLLLLELNYWQ